MHTTPPPDRFVNAYDASKAKAGPVLHASHRAPVPVGDGGRYRVLCGRTARNVTTVAWSPVGLRRCAECVNETLRRAAQDIEAP